MFVFGLGITAAGAGPVRPRAALGRRRRPPPGLRLAVHRPGPRHGRRRLRRRLRRRPRRARRHVAGLRRRRRRASSSPAVLLLVAGSGAPASVRRPRLDGRRRRGAGRHAARRCAAIWADPGAALDRARHRRPWRWASTPSSSRAAGLRPDRAHVDETRSASPPPSTASSSSRCRCVVVRAHGQAQRRDACSWSSAPIWTLSWLVLAGASLAPELAAALFVTTFGIFAVGETMYAPVLNPLTASLAPPGLVGTTLGMFTAMQTRLLGRGPLVAGVVLGAGLGRAVPRAARRHQPGRRLRRLAPRRACAGRASWHGDGPGGRGAGRLTGLPVRRPQQVATAQIGALSRTQSASLRLHVGNGIPHRGRGADDWMGTVVDGVQITGASGERLRRGPHARGARVPADLHRDLRRAGAASCSQARDERVQRAGRRRDARLPARDQDDPRGRLWRVAPPAAGLQDRRVEITGPTDRKMTINALNSGAKVWLADFEDANTPALGEHGRRASST